MSTEEFGGASMCKQRFKGIESFLRRIAFNLGNTPSQTEVKIISCIPIDVTDLQQKIIHLEKQLDEAKYSPDSFAQHQQPSQEPQSSKLPKSISKGKRTAVNTALTDNKFPRVSTTAVTCKSLECDQSTSPTCLQSKKKSNVSFIVPNADEHNPTSNENSAPSQTVIETKPCVKETYDPSPKMTDPRHHDNRRKFFKNKKKLLKRSKNAKSPYVYYAQTNSSPFNKTDVVPNVSTNDNNLMSRSYLSNMVNKQYKPKLLGGHISQMSEFSSPICRDTLPHAPGYCRYESDVCSCCHGPFHNIDNSIQISTPQTYMLNEMNTGSAYYDTKHYDLVPVREKSIKIKNDFDMPKRKEPKAQIDMKCWPENVRTKYRRYSQYPTPTMFSYQSVPLKSDYIKSRPVDNYHGRKMQVKPTKPKIIEPTAKKIAIKIRKARKTDHCISIETSKSCSIDFGTIYPKKVYKKPKRQKSLQPIPVLRKNAECLTTAINNSECQTVMSNVEANLSDAKTEATLNQIKSILQSVLEEVKVSSQTRSHISEDKPKKDAVVQKGPSHNNMQASTLMNSITYSPYTMNPNPYMASCSRQLNSSQFYYPPAPLKCFQNFPLFIHNPARQMCTSCYRNTSQIKSANIRQATTIATNTDSVKEERSKETEKLIKEIYKSMALTMDITNKDTSMSECDDLPKSEHVFKSLTNVVKVEPIKVQKKIKNVVQAMSELFMKKDVIETSDTPNTTLESKLPSHNASTRSQLVETDTETRLRRARLEKYLRSRTTATPTIVEPEKRIIRKSIKHNVPTITESETSSTETQSDITLVMPKETQEPKQKKEKHGLFRKMLKSVKLFKAKEKIKKKEEKSEEDIDTSSDSDDYQTIYSQKIEKTLNQKNRAQNLPKRKTHSKISYKQTYQRDKSPEKKRSPYMEQEYRRYWNEKLMFSDNKARQSSEQAYSGDTSHSQKSPYYQTFETRNAYVEPKKPYARKTNERSQRGNRAISTPITEPSLPTKGLAWLKKRKMGIQCGEQWKKLILEN